MPGNSLVIAQSGECVTWPDCRVAQIDVVHSRLRAIDRSGSCISVGCAVLDRGRHAFHDQIAMHQGCECLRQPRSDVGNPSVDVVEYLLTTGIGVRELITRILPEGSHAFARSPLREPLSP